MGVHISQLPQHIKDKLGLKDPKHKQFWAIIGDKQPIFFRSSWEFYYACFLEKLKQEGKIKEWFHECKTFWFLEIKRGVRSYLPDFLVIHNNNTEEWSEVKGFYDSKSITKMKRMAKYYPEVKIRLVGADWFKANLKACKAIAPLLGKVVQNPMPSK
jgi:hypothetical protein